MNHPKPAHAATWTKEMGEMFPVTVFVQWQSHDGQPMWKYLCVVYDNEALGWLEQLFQQSKVTFKLTPTPQPSA